MVELAFQVLRQATVLFVGISDVGDWSSRYESALLHASCMIAARQRCDGACHHDHLEERKQCTLQE